MLMSTARLGETIKALRRERDITQEQLAAYLNISPQSVSKWETTSALPDITLLEPLANFFGVTIDTLFGRDETAAEAELAQYRTRDYNLAHIRTREATSARIALWREAVQKYPRNFDCLRLLAYALHDTLLAGFTPAEREANARELVEICTRILRDCTDTEPRESAIQLLTYTYSHPALTFADEAKAVAYANRAGSLRACREVLLEQAYFTPEGRRLALAQRHENDLVFLDLLCQDLTRPPFAAPADEMAALNTATALWATLIPDGNYLFYHTRLAEYHTRLARLHAAEGRYRETLTALTQAHRHARAFDTIPPDVDYRYTARAVSSASSRRHPLDGCMAHFRAELREACFDFVRELPEFAVLFQ